MDSTAASAGSSSVGAAAAAAENVAPNVSSSTASLLVHLPSLLLSLSLLRWWLGDDDNDDDSWFRGSFRPRLPLELLLAAATVDPPRGTLKLNSGNGTIDKTAGDSSHVTTNPRNKKDLAAIISVSNWSMERECAARGGFRQARFRQSPPAWFRGSFLSVLYLSAASTVDGTRSEGCGFWLMSEIGWLEHNK
jgi:hypothetical protein